MRIGIALRAKTVVCCSVFLIAASCKRQRSLGSVDVARRAAVSAGCDLSTGKFESTCRVWVGPCNCALSVQTLAGDELDDLQLIGADLSQCPFNTSPDRLFPIIDPFLRDDDHRVAVHALLASRPRIAGADDFSTIEIHKTIGGVRVEVKWRPDVYRGVDMASLANRAHMPQRISVTLKTASTDFPEETNVVPTEPQYGKPLYCQDGTLRPWETAAPGRK